MITLDEAKAYLRVDWDREDEVISAMVAAAVQHLASIGCDVETEPAPAPLKQAALMLVGHSYDNRGVDTDGTRLSPVFMRLVAPYREIEL